MAHSLVIAKQFSKEGVKDAIINHMKNKTSFVDFLADIAASGVSHYIVDMNIRTATYFNDNESEFQQENIPHIHDETKRNSQYFYNSFEN